MENFNLNYVCKNFTKKMFDMCWEEVLVLPAILKSYGVYVG